MEYKKRKMLDYLYLSENLPSKVLPIVIKLMLKKVGYDYVLRKENGVPFKKDSDFADAFGIPNKYWGATYKKILLEHRIIGKNESKEYVLNPFFTPEEKQRFNIGIYKEFEDELSDHLEIFVKYIRSKMDFMTMKPILEGKISNEKMKLLEFKFGDNQYIVTNKITKNHGVYLLYKDNNIIYIGQSKNIKTRITTHKKDKDFDFVKSIIFKDAGNISLYEPYLINKYKPILNKQFNENYNMISLPEIEGI